MYLYKYVFKYMSTYVISENIYGEENNVNVINIHVGIHISVLWKKYLC